MIRVSDYAAGFLVEHGMRDIFLVSGGAIMHLVDSVGRQAGLRYWCNYHEQACGVSAEGYARATGGVGACLATAGPGGANLVTGLIGAWVDSIPVLALVGQVRRDLVADYGKVRQIGPQEGNIVGMARPVTKLALTVSDPSAIRRDLERALHAAVSGRPGPVLVEIPLDVQGSMVDPAVLERFPPPPPPATDRLERLRTEARGVLDLLRRARRPLFVGGNGIHLARAEALFSELLRKLPVPAVFPDAAKDLVAEDHPRNMGIFGTAGQRRANFAVQNCDCLVSLAAGLCVKKVGFNYQGFAPRARKVIVDIDEGQLRHQRVKADIAVQADIREFLELLLAEAERAPLDASPRWLAACARWRERYPLVTDDCRRDPSHVNSYVFVDRLSDAMGARDVLVAGNGLDTVSYIQAFRVKEGQRTMTSINWGAMGWDLPLAVGACVGSGRRRTVCLTGDGSIQLNIQELMTLGHHRLPVKIFLFNNMGYASIRATQRTFFDGRLVASDPSSGVANPDFSALAAAYGLRYDRIRDNAGAPAGIRRVLESDGPVLCEVNISPEQEITPKASAVRRDDGTFESRPLEDMSPFLPREEVRENMSLFDDEDEGGGGS